MISVVNAMAAMKSPTENPKGTIISGLPMGRCGAEHTDYQYHCSWCSDSHVVQWKGKSRSSVFEAEKEGSAKAQGCLLQGTATLESRFAACLH